MDFIYLTLLSIGLAMDAFSVCTASSASLKNVSLYHASKVSFSFGVFHIIMPVLGWLAGSRILSVIFDYDHWTAFLLLLFVGGKMIFDAFKTDYIIESNKILNNLNLFLLSVAVSIDAVAMGLSFYLENMPILNPALLIGAVTFVCSFIGMIIGQRIGRLIGKGAQVLGGCVLIIIGLKIVITHIL